jgi:uncharacterized protein (TIGR03086 family)
MEPIEQLSHIVRALHTTVDGIQPSQLNNPTPCSEFTVHDVLDHMMVTGGSFTYWFRGETAPELMPPPVYGRVPAAEFHETIDDLIEAASGDGALEQTLTTPMGQMSGDVAARLVAFDGLVHLSDLAIATGQQADLPDEVVIAVDEFARAAVTDDMRDIGMFKPETTPPAGAGRLEQLLAFSGRSR